MRGSRSTNQTSSDEQATKPPAHKLSPRNSIVCIRQEGIVTLSKDEIQPEAVGWKAFGLCSLPVEWVPKFLVVDADCCANAESEAKFSDWLQESVQRAGIRTSSFKVRSSGTGETIQYRGRLKSATCTFDEILPAIKSHIAKLPGSIPGKVHWIVQEFVTPERLGHLSNERHVSKEKRDWVAETELKEGAAGYSIAIAVRRWRDGDRIADSALACSSEMEISFCLKRVAMWAERLASRMHFEWVWNGSAIRVVQADIARAIGGIDPTSLVPSSIPDVSIKGLTAFKPATSHHYKTYAKLRNAKTYQDLGYKMPVFYVLDDQKQIAQLLSGKISNRLERDLEELTKRPLIVRTDGKEIPSEKREMLPRSESNLRSLNEARDWLVGSFRSNIEKAGLQESSLCLIAHHFIPSLASAWARAKPGERFVRVEALWGLPEGLYWYSHDTYEVDTLDVAIKIEKIGAKYNYQQFRRLRYKGTFVAPDDSGNWVPYQTLAPFDWRPTISKEGWLYEIAHTTRLVAEREKRAVAVMWFIGNHSAATQHEVLPWFHNPSGLEETPKAAPRRKVRSARDFVLESTGDWEELKHLVTTGRPIERIIVKPTDCSLIRNPEFATDLANFAAANRIVIELAGGVLTHAYYILHRQGAQVECTDLFGAEEDVVEYNKVVRDKIPSQIESRGERVELVQLTGGALTVALCQKLVEEALEALDSKSGDELIGELADVEEVMLGLLHALRVSKGQIENERLNKLKRRGGFRNGYMLTKTLSPHSLQAESRRQGDTLGLHPKELREIVVSRPEDIPTAPTYRRPDLRQVQHELEKLFVFETEIKKITNLTESVNFALPIKSGDYRNFALTVEIRRQKASLRTNIRLRLQPAQMSMEFDSPQLALNFPK